MNSLKTALVLLPLIAITGYICPFYDYDKFTPFFAIGFFVHGYLVLSHPWVKFEKKAIVITYIVGIISALLGYIQELNSVVIVIMAIGITLHFTSKPTDAFKEFEKLDKEKQDKIKNRKFLKSLIIGVIAFLIGGYMISNIEKSFNNYKSNDTTVKGNKK